MGIICTIYKYTLCIFICFVCIILLYLTKTFVKEQEPNSFFSVVSASCSRNPLHYADLFPALIDINGFVPCWTLTILALGTFVQFVLWFEQQQQHTHKATHTHTHTHKVLSLSSDLGGRTNQEDQPSSFTSLCFSSSSPPPSFLHLCLCLIRLLPPSSSSMCICNEIYLL